MNTKAKAAQGHEGLDIVTCTAGFLGGSPFCLTPTSTPEALVGPGTLSFNLDTKITVDAGISIKIDGIPQPNDPFNPGTYEISTGQVVTLEVDDE